MRLTGAAGTRALLDRLSRLCKGGAAAIRHGRTGLCAGDFRAAARAPGGYSKSPSPSPPEACVLSEERSDYLGAHNAEIRRLGLQHRAWRRPATFIPNHARDLAAAGAASEAWAAEAAREFKAAEADPNTVMTTPLVMEIIAEKV